MKSIRQILIACYLGLILCVNFGFAQVTNPLGRPSLVLPPLPNSHQIGAGFDAFAAPPESGQLQMGPMRSLNIPIGSWGSVSQWDICTLNSTTIKRFRKKLVQRVDIASGWIVKDGNDGFGSVFAGTGISMGIPLSGADNVVLVAPRFQVDWLDGPTQVDVPAHLYSLSVDFGWRVKFNDRFTTIVGVRPGWYVDGNTSASGFRTSGLAVVNYGLIPKRLTATVGVVYLDRNDFSWLPAIGLNYYPSPDVRIDLIFPKPKIARRIGHIPYLLEDWVYVAGAIGGNTWSVLRASGLPDELTLRDYRIALGLERVIDGGTGFHLEFGYVFARNLEYLSSGLEVGFDGTLILQSGISF